MIGRVVRGASPTGWRVLAIGTVLASAVWAAHGGAIGGAFHYDDVFVVVNNPAVRSWQPARMFTSADAVNSVYGAAIYRPLMALSLAVNYRISGLDPLGYLATNMALHFLIATGIVLIGRELFGNLRWAALAGLVFALHPLNAEAVNYVTARSSLLSTVLALAATWTFVRYVERRGGAGTLVAGLTAFGGAMLSKESAVVLVVPLLAYPWLRPQAPSSPARSRAVTPLVAYGVLAAGYVILWRLITASGMSAPGPPADRPAWTLVEVVARSLALWVWPWPLGLDHPLTFLTRFDGWLAAGLALGGVGFLAVAVVLARRVPVAAWGLLWAVAGLAPLAPLPWLTTVALLQEHRVGFSAVGLSWTTAALMRVAWDAAGPRRSERIIRSGLACVGVVLVVAAISVGRARSAVWQDDRRLWAEVVQRSPHNLPARINLGYSYADRGEHDRAEAEYREVIALAPAYPRVYYNLGLLALRRARPLDAVAAFQRTVALDPSNAAAHAHLGNLALQAGDEKAAEAALQAALRIDPTQRAALNNLAAIFLARRDWSKALSLVDEALRRDPDFIEAAYHRGVALSGLGRRAEADVVLREVRRRLPPDDTFDPYRSGIDHLLAGGVP
jgi:tetratricopeptide (TPR) repeat protein